MPAKRQILGILATLRGVVMILADREIRSLAMWPLLISAVSYVLAVWAAIKSHSYFLGWLVGTPVGFWMNAWFYIAWVLVALALLMLTMVVSFVVISVISGPFQSQISATLLRRAGYTVSEEGGIKGIAKEATRSIRTEVLKFLWFLPFALVCTVAGFIPILLPVALILGSWLLAYRFIDVPLDVLRVSVRERFNFAVRHTPTLLGFGASLTALWAIPFAGILLAPGAAAGATWLMIETKMINDFAQIAAGSKPAVNGVPATS